jgi:hypothetical protein
MAVGTRPDLDRSMSPLRDSSALVRLPLIPPPGVGPNAEKGEQLRMCRMSG